MRKSTTMTRLRPGTTNPTTSSPTGTVHAGGTDQAGVLPKRHDRSSQPQYVLGSSDAEIARLDAQAANIAPATGLLLRAAGISGGMRVLDLGTGLGHVAFQVAELVGPSGAVHGIDQSAPLLEVAEQRRRAAGVENVHFIHAEARTFHADEPFDAVVARLLLFHLPDPVEVLRHHLQALKPDGSMLMVDFDVGSVRAEPPVPLVSTAVGWVEAAFRNAGANPRIGTHLGLLLRNAGLVDLASFGVQAYLAPDDRQGPRLLAGVVGALASQIVAAGIATESELELDTLQARIAREIQVAGSAVLPPAVAGAWGRRAFSTTTH